MIGDCPIGQRRSFSRTDSQSRTPVPTLPQAHARDQTRPDRGKTGGKEGDGKKKALFPPPPLAGSWTGLLHAATSSTGPKSTEDDQMVFECLDGLSTGMRLGRIGGVDRKFNQDHLQSDAPS